MALVSSSMVTISMDDGLDLDLSGCSTTTTTTTTTATTTTTTSNTDHQHGCTWNDWSPVVDWDAFTGGHDDFRDLIESMMDEDGVKLDTSREIDQEGCNSNSTASTADAMIVDEETNGSDEDTKGLRLVHLLMAAAEALTGANKSRDLARVIFVRLKELSSPTDGSNMERLAAYFTDALQGLLEGARDTVHGKHFISNGPHHRDDYHHHHHHHQTEVIAAFQLLQDMSPYVKFGHFTANQAILEAVVHDRRVHIVDYDIMEGIQWASLMQALVSKKDGPPAPHLRITALTRGNGGRRQIGTIQETGRRLVAFAASIGQPFSFHQCRMDSDETFTPYALKLVKGETLIFNCMLNLPHFSYRSPESIASFLSGAKTLSPSLMTLVEEEVMTVGDGGFVARFIDSLYHYSAVYDSLEAGCPTQTRSRALVERVFIGPRIAGSLGRIYRADKDEMCSWGNWLVSMGSKAVQISNTNRVQAKLLLGLFNDGYRVEELANNRLVLGWKSRRLLSASVWTS